MKNALSLIRVFYCWLHVHSFSLCVSSLKELFVTVVAYSSHKGALHVHSLREIQ